MWKPEEGLIPLVGLGYVSSTAKRTQGSLIVPASLSSVWLGASRLSETQKCFHAWSLSEGVA